MSKRPKEEPINHQALGDCCPLHCPDEPTRNASLSGAVPPAPPRGCVARWNRAAFIPRGKLVIRAASRSIGGMGCFCKIKTVPLMREECERPSVLGGPLVLDWLLTADLWLLSAAVSRPNHDTTRGASWVETFKIQITFLIIRHHSSFEEKFLVLTRTRATPAPIDKGGHPPRTQRPGCVCPRGVCFGE